MKKKRIAYKWKPANREPINDSPLKFDGLNFLRGRRPAKCPEAFKPLRQKAGKTRTSIERGSAIMQNSYHLRFLLCGKLDVYNNESLCFVPQVSEYFLAVVFCLKGVTNARIEGGVTLPMREGRFQVLLLRNDDHRCIFARRLSSFFYFLLPARNLPMLEQRRQFRGLPALKGLQEYARRGETLVYDRPQQVITGQMGQLIKEMQSLPNSLPELEDALFAKAMDLIFKALKRVGQSDSSSKYNATRMFKSLYDRAERKYEELLIEFPFESFY